MTDEARKGVDPDKLLEHRARYSAAQIKLNEATAENQAELKRIKSEGTHIDALKFVYKLDKKDPAEAATLMRAIIEGALIMNCAFMHQGDMLEGGSIADMLKVPQASAKAIENFQENLAWERGYNWQTDGGALDGLSDFYDPGSALLDAATRGFALAKHSAEKIAVDGVAKVAGRRGRRKKAEVEAADSDDDKEDAPAPEVAAALESDIEIDMVEVQAMSNAQMAHLWNRITGNKIVRFENRDVGLSKLTALYAAQKADRPEQPSA